MNILYLTYDGLSDPLGQSQILPYLSGLLEKSYNITVISFEKEEIKNQKLDNSKLKIIPLKYHKSPPVLSTLYDLYMLIKEVKKVLKDEQVDIIHCRSYITSLVGLWAKRKYGLKFVFDMRGFWADERVEGGLWNLNNSLFRKIYRLFKKKEKDFINEADAIISLTESAKTEILGWKDTKVYHQKITVIPTCSDVELFDPEKVSANRSVSLKKQLGIGERDFVLLYLGSLGTWYMLDEMLDFFCELKKQKGATEENHPLSGFDKVRFLFVSKEQDVLKEAVDRKGIQKEEIIITFCIRQEVPDHISICHASIFFILPTFSKKASAATKMGETMAMGKPVITNSGWGDVDHLVQDANGVLVNEIDQEGYSTAISHFFNCWPYKSQDIREQAMQRFSLESGIKKYDEIYVQLKA